MENYYSYFSTIYVSSSGRCCGVLLYCFTVIIPVVTAHYLIEKLIVMRLFCEFQTFWLSSLPLLRKLKKSCRGPKFDGDAKQTLEIRVKRKVALKSLRLQRAKKGKKRGKKEEKSSCCGRESNPGPSECTYHRTVLNV